MAFGVIIPQKTMAQNIDALNRVGIHATVDMENGGVVRLDSKSSTAGEGEVWTATQITTSAGLLNVWMVYSPEIVVTVSGTSQFKGIDPDVRNFKNLATKTFDCFKPQVGDIILMSEDAFDNAKSTNTYAVATDQKWQLVWGSAAVSGLTLKYVATKYISIADGTIGNQRITAYEMEVVAVA